MEGFLQSVFVAVEEKCETRNSSAATESPPSARCACCTDANRQWEETGAGRLSRRSRAPAGDAERGLSIWLTGKREIGAVSRCLTVILSIGFQCLILLCMSLCVVGV